MNKLQQKSKLFLWLGLIALAIEVLYFANLSQLDGTGLSGDGTVELLKSIVVFSLFPAGLLLLSLSYAKNLAWAKYLGLFLIAAEIVIILAIGLL